MGKGRKNRGKGENGENEGTEKKEGEIWGGYARKGKAIMKKKRNSGGSEGEVRGKGEKIRKNGEKERTGGKGGRWKKWREKM